MDVSRYTGGIAHVGSRSGRAEPQYHAAGCTQGEYTFSLAGSRGCHSLSYLVFLCAFLLPVGTVDPYGHYHTRGGGFRVWDYCPRLWRILLAIACALQDLINNRDLGLHSPCLVASELFNGFSIENDPTLSRDRPSTSDELAAKLSLRAIRLLEHPQNERPWILSICE